MRLLLFYILCSLSLQNAFAQHTIEEKMTWYALAKPTSNFFVHFDKNVYSNNETVYFTGYIIKTNTVPASLHKVMAIALVREADNTLIAEDKFIMDKGLSFGSLTLPDSIPTGNYRFLVYTDRLINNIPEVLFIQNITIKSSIDPSFKVSVKLIEEPNINKKPIKVLLSAWSGDGGFLAKPAAITYSYDGIKKNAFTDASGQLIINLPERNNPSDPNLYVKLKYERDSTFINLLIPQFKNKAVVKFYPEGGNMVNGLMSNIGWEVKDEQNRPIALKAFLYKNNEIIDTIETSSYGIGKFVLNPKMGSTYSVKLVHSNLTDSVYYLPKAATEGLTVTLQNALVYDTLKINSRSIKKQNLTLFVHNFKESFLSIPFEMKNGNTMIKLALNGVPKGLTTLTILDSLNRPLAERLFFARYSDADKIAIATDQAVYNQREKVSLKFKLQGDDNALVSIAVVQNNRLELKKMNDIESYTYLINELSTIPVASNGRPYTDRNYLEQVLLVKGWRRYTWQDLQNVTIKENHFKLDSLQVKGFVSKNKKELTTPTTVGVFGDEKLRLLTTSSKGVFDFYSSELMLEQGKKTYLFVNEKNKFAYQIQIKDAFKLMSEQLAKTPLAEQTLLPSNLLNNSDLVLKGSEKAIRLNEVVIKAKVDNSFRFGRGGQGSNACGDYVCSYNILNCRNHANDPGNTQPVEGVTYSGSNGPYHGCKINGATADDTFIKFKGIHLQKEFYHDDYKDPKEPAFFSTIYWNYGTLLNSKKETELSFYTSDITGKFRIVVQGITDKDVIYGEHFFEVIKK